MDTHTHTPPTSYYTEESYTLLVSRFNPHTITTTACAHGQLGSICVAASTATVPSAVLYVVFGVLHAACSRYAVCAASVLCDEVMEKLPPRWAVF